MITKRKEKKNSRTTHLSIGGNPSLGIGNLDSQCPSPSNDIDTLPG